MTRRPSKDKVMVLGKRGHPLSSCTRAKALRSVRCGHARWVASDTIILLLDHNERERIRSYVIGRDGLQCYYCGDELSEDEVTIDHKVPKDAGGSNYPENLCVCCDDCNNRKRNMPLSEFEAIIARERERWQ